MLIAGGFVLGEVLILLYLPAVWWVVCVVAAVCGAAAVWKTLGSRSTGLWLLLFCAAVLTGIGRGRAVQQRTEATYALLPEKGQGEVTGKSRDYRFRQYGPALL